MRTSAKVHRLKQAGLELERAAMSAGRRLVAGVDEAGRGPLAGPVAVAAVILDPQRPIEGLADSKTLTVARREAMFQLILERAMVSVTFQPARIIDAINIHESTLLGMREALMALPSRPDFALIDGKDVPRGLPFPAQAVIDGDAISASIAAASIVAKTMRDRLMSRMDGTYPGYEFARHAGYGVPAHRSAIARIGPCPLHRLSFAPFRNGTPDAL